MNSLFVGSLELTHMCLRNSLKNYNFAHMNILTILYYKVLVYVDSFKDIGDWRPASLEDFV